MPNASLRIKVNVRGALPQNGGHLMHKSGRGLTAFGRYPHGVVVYSQA